MTSLPSSLLFSFGFYCTFAKQKAIFGSRVYMERVFALFIVFITGSAVGWPVTTNKIWLRQKLLFLLGVLLLEWQNTHKTDVEGFWHRHT
jgi:hypothetical protein